MIPITILVTGSSGLLGAEVVREFHEAGHAVTALNRAAGSVPDGVRFVADDLSSRERLEALLGGVEAIAHCAAYATPHAAREDIVFTGNVTATAHLLYAAEAAGVARFVYASSQSALGLAYAHEIVPPDALPVDETHPCRPGDGYALSKIVGEELCAMISSRARLATACLRFPVIWSPARFAEHTQRRLGDPAQAAKSQWAYIDVRDAARACRLAAEVPSPPHHRVYNIAAPWPFACDDAERLIGLAYGTVPHRPGWRPGEAVFAVDRAREELGFAAAWRWTPGGIVEAGAD